MNIHYVKLYMKCIADLMFIISGKIMILTFNVGIILSNESLLVSNAIDYYDVSTYFKNRVYSFSIILLKICKFAVYSTSQKDFLPNHLRETTGHASFQQIYVKLSQFQQKIKLVAVVCHFNNYCTQIDPSITEQFSKVN